MAYFFQSGYDSDSSDDSDISDEFINTVLEAIRLTKIDVKIIRKKRIVRNKTCLICKDFKTYYNYKHI